MMEKNLTKLNLTLNVCILIICGITLWSIYKYFKEKRTDESSFIPKRDAEIPKDIAESMAGDYRSGAAADTITNIVIYDANSFKGYVDNNFMKCTGSIKLPDPYHWKMALVPMYKDTLLKTRLTVALMPVIVDTVSNNVYDYFECKNSNASDAVRRRCFAFFEAADAFATSYNFKSFIYDEGHLYP